MALSLFFFCDTTEPFFFLSWSFSVVLVPIFLLPHLEGHLLPGVGVIVENCADSRRDGLHCLGKGGRTGVDKGPTFTVVKGHEFGTHSQRLILRAVAFHKMPRSSLALGVTRDKSQAIFAQHR